MANPGSSGRTCLFSGVGHGNTGNAGNAMAAHPPGSWTGGWRHGGMVAIVLKVCVWGGVTYSGGPSASERGLTWELGGRGGSAVAAELSAARAAEAARSGGGCAPVTRVPSREPGAPSEGAAG